MRDSKLVSAIRRLKVETGSLACIGCGHEHNCGVSGCAVMREAADRIANQSTHIAALQKEIEKLRGQNKQLREAAALVAKESAELLERRWIPVEERLPATESWGASKVVLGIVQNESGYPPPNPCFCVYLGNQQWTIRGRMATITHWMPLPEPPEVENA